MRNDTNIVFRNAECFSLIEAVAAASVWSMVRGYVRQQKLSSARCYSLEILGADLLFNAFGAQFGRDQIISCGPRPQFFEFGIAQKDCRSPWCRRSIF